MVTVMSAILVVAILGVFEPQIKHAVDERDRLGQRQQVTDAPGNAMPAPRWSSSC